MNWQQFFLVWAWVCGGCGVLAIIIGVGLLGTKQITETTFLIILATLAFLTALFGGLAAGLR